jgi:hypothetical protein
MQNVPTEATKRFLQSITPPEEDRRRYTSAPWDGSFRWFRSVNIIPLEQYRQAPPGEPKDLASS